MISDACGKNLNRSVLAANADALFALNTTSGVSAWHQAADKLLPLADADTLGQSQASVTSSPGCGLQDSGLHRETETGQTDIGVAPASVAATHVNKTESKVTMEIGFVRGEARNSLGAITAVRLVGPRGPLASCGRAGAAR